MHNPPLEAVAEWLCTLAVHSTIALGSALLISVALRDRARHLQESLLRLSMWVAVASSVLQCLFFEGVLAPSLVLSSVPFATTAATTDAATGLFAAAAGEFPTIAERLSWTTIVLTVAGASAMLGLLWLVSVYRRLSRVLAGRQPETAARILATAAEVALGQGLRQSPHVSRCARIATPIAFGWLRPEICLPMRAGDLADDSLRAMLAHEVAHLRKADPAWMWLSAWLQALLPWQPLLCFVRRRWSRLVELRCDAMAAQQSSPTAVARCLVDVAEWLQSHRQHTVALGMAARPSALRERVEAVLQCTDVRAPNRTAASLVAVFSLSAMTVAAPGFAPAPRSDEVETQLPPPSAVASPDAVPLQLLLDSLRAEQAELQTAAAQLRAEMRGLRITTELSQMEATLRRRLLDLDRLRQRVEALLEGRANRSR